MIEPCCTCMAHIGNGGACGLFCRLFYKDTIEATERFCQGHKYHMSLIEYKEIVFKRDTSGQR